MITEKKVAIIVLLLGLVIPVWGIAPYIPAWSSISLYDYIINLLQFFWGPLFLACILYSRVRPAAVTGAAVVINIVFLLTGIGVSININVGSDVFWYIYLIAGVGAFLLSIYPAFIRPAFFSYSTLRACLLSAVITIISFSMVIVSIVSEIFDVLAIS